MKEPPQAQHQARILLADDAPDILEVVSVLLASEGYRVDAARDGLEALALARYPFDLAILDVMMPKASGLEVCERLRLSSNAPILFLTARSQDADKVAGLAVGGDDYLVKPFSTPELLARVKAMLRRYRQYGSAQGAQTGETIQAGPVLIDTRARRVSKGETPVAPRRVCARAVRERVAQHVPSPIEQHRHGAHKEPAQEARSRSSRSADRAHGMGAGIHH